MDMLPSREYLDGRCLVLANQSEKAPAVQLQKVSAPPDHDAQDREARLVEDALNKFKDIVIDKEGRVDRVDQLPVAVWNGQACEVVVPRPKGRRLDTLGVPRRGGSRVLRPEQALFLLECNKVRLSLEGEDGPPVSVGEAMRLLVNADGVTEAERRPGLLSYSQYRVFSHLSRLGFTVVRHAKVPSLPFAFKPTRERISEEPPDAVLTSGQGASLWASSGTRPLLQPRHATSAQAVRERIRLGGARPGNCGDDGGPEITFDVFAPGTKATMAWYRRTRPSHRVVVVPGGRRGRVPSGEQMLKLVVPFSDRVPLICGVVDDASVSFFLVADVNPLPKVVEEQEDPISIAGFSSYQKL